MFDKKAMIFIPKYIFENVVCDVEAILSRPRCVIMLALHLGKRQLAFIRSDVLCITTQYRISVMFFFLVIGFELFFTEQIRHFNTVLCQDTKYIAGKKNVRI